MKSISIRINVVNPKSRSVYAEVRASRGKILRIFGPDFINSDLWFHTFKLFSHG